MNFADMVAQLQLGKYVRRPSWANKYLMMPYGVNQLVIVDFSKGIDFELVFHQYCPCEDDLMADDWLVI